MLEKIKATIVSWAPAILYEVKSILQTFLAGGAFFLAANWELVKQLSFTKSAIIGLAIAVLRAGVKMVWTFLEPQILSFLKFLINWGKK